MSAERAIRPFTVNENDGVYEESVWGICDTTHNRMRYILTSYELPLFKGSSDCVWKYRRLLLKFDVYDKGFYFT